MSDLNLLFKGTCSKTFSYDGYPELFIDLKEGSITDVAKGMVYLYDKLEDITRVNVSTIPGLESFPNLSLASLYAVTVTNLSLPLELILDESGGIKFYYLNSSLLTGIIDQDSVVPLFPLGGIESSKPGFVYIPGCSDYAVKSNGKVWFIPGDYEVTVGTDERDPFVYKLSSDNNGLVSLHIGDILTLAFGKYSGNDYLKEAQSLSKDTGLDSYTSVNNWMKSKTVVREALVALTEKDQRVD